VSIKLSSELTTYGQIVDVEFLLKRVCLRFASDSANSNCEKLEKDVALTKNKTTNATMRTDWRKVKQR
jgi:hypothetical protein